MAGVSGSGVGISDYLDRPNAIHRRTASLAIARSGDDGPRIVDGAGREGRRARSSRRLSLSSWLGPLSRHPPHPHADEDTASADSRSREPTPEPRGGRAKEPSPAWRSWKPVRALAHIGKRRAGCLFSVEVASVRGVPASMDGLRLAVAVRKAETRDGAMQTMPARVSRDGSAEFDETLFVKCNLFFTGGPGTGKPLKLEPRRFVVSVVPVEAPEIRLGTYDVDVSELVRDSLQRSNEGRRVRWFDRAYGLAGKAAGGELLLRLGFQLMEDAGLRLYTQAAAGPSSSRDVSVSPSRARAHSKNSFSISSSTPKLSASDASISHSMRAYRQLLDRLNVEKRADDDELSTASGTGDGDYASIPEYEVVDKGVESVKEVVHFQAQRDVLRELDSIADQIEAVEALMASGGKKSPRGAGQQPSLDADEEMVTVEFLRKLEAVDDDKYRKLKQPMTPRSREAAATTPPVVPDLGQSLGPAVQTRDGGFLLSMNPFNVPLASRDVPPMLAMQLSRPFVLPSAMAATGFDVLQKMAAAGGPNEVRDKLVSLGGMESLTGKTPEQVGFEGIAEAVIGGRRTEGGASSSAARSVQLVRKFAAAVSEGRRERVATGIWSAGSDPETLEEVLAFSLQKLEAMALDALMIQADMADEEPPFEVAPAAGDVDVFDALVPCEEWSDTRGVSDGRVTLVAAIQLRDPSRRYEAVGAPMVAVVQSARMLGAAGISGGRFKVRSLHVGGVQTRSSSGVGGSASWRAERQKLTAMQWTVAHGPGRAGKRVQTPPSSQAAKARQQQQQQRPDVVWSLSSRVLAGMWLKTVRNPDVKIGSA
ncbi:protein PLASTID MOVEMENT IMPAIRED 1-like [Lolium rigidum]|uniref:protein PLASTID MOVEMENT IMPAIRED 1-like n=1 Tax=Lolium rigidum TaxID=89674 RepID=UPI001F5C3D6B|nr:protein PLASTID MOVEMENT IMPAIRED 1-like [Lolium rigidum]